MNRPCPKPQADYEFVQSNFSMDLNRPVKDVKRIYLQVTIGLDDKVIYACFWSAR